MVILGIAIGFCLGALVTAAGLYLYLGWLLQDVDGVLEIRREA